MCVSLAKQMLEESKAMQDANKLQEHLQRILQFAEAHAKVINEWGRFPHRNQILGRDNTPKEEEGIAKGSIPNF